MIERAILIVMDGCGAGAAVRGEEEQALTAQVYENARTLFQW